MTHELKIWPQFYVPVADRIKTFEIRRNDRGFQKGDTVILREWNPQNNKYTGTQPLEFEIGYVYPIDVETVVFSLLDIDEAVETLTK